MQMEALECGAACLTMVLAYYEKWVPLEQVRVDCGVSRDGSKAKNILNAARSYGLEARGFRSGSEALRKSGEFPCIVHWNYSHFVVLCGFRGKYAFINDPARGSVKVTTEEFEKSFTGVVLTFTPGEQFRPGGKQASVLSFARKSLEGAWGAVAFVMLTSLIGYLFTVINPALSRFFVDRLLTGENRELLLPFIVIAVFAALLQIITEAVRAVFALRINGKMAVVGSGTFMWKLLRLPMEFYSQRMAGDIQTRQAANSTVAATLVNTISPLALSALMMVFYLAVMLRYSPLLTLVGLVSIALNLWISRLISEKRINITRVMMRDNGRLAAATVSGIQMIETIKASGSEDGYFRRWGDYQASVNARITEFVKLNQYLGVVPAFITALANALVLVLGVWLAMEGHFTLGMVTAFQGFLAAFMSPAMQLVTAGRQIQEMRTQMERIEDVMEYPEDSCFQAAPESGEEAYDKLTGLVELKNVTFGYSRLDPPLMENFSMTVRPGGCVALVGASGCGKSTIAKLISGLYEPWSGEILFDGRPISQIDRDVFTSSVAVVDQDIILFDDTVANNIRMWDDAIENFEVILACRDAQIHDDIMARPGGYQGRISEGGQDLSGGQRQRLEIARVLAQDPHVVIMDEATSALDARTEFELVKAVRERGVACIMIAHRLSTIRDADEIIVLDHGKVVERGTHEELFAKGGYYAELISND
ncbi:MAG: NHLP family bacteriocin export ABC transporter peptidase/permease/ATPase subunit [Oscillospiraceae bacterium]|nr:NHLP family bacteriocin export ABC transporter peptidase/permease/ATPase subunit [Oscillospiraceae bacterium]